MCEFIPFYTTFDSEYNEVYLFTVKPSNPKNKKNYIVTITIDGMNDSLLIKKECTCVAGYYKPSISGQCKHIKASLDLLKKFGVAFREEINESPTKEERKPKTQKSN
jgi:hypothetical protein